MRLVEADFESLAVRMPPGWAAVKDADAFWGDLSRHGRRLLKELLEGTMELWRDEWAQVEWHRPTANRKTCRNGYYSRGRWPTALGVLPDVRVAPLPRPRPHPALAGPPGRPSRGLWPSRSPISCWLA